MFNTDEKLMKKWGSVLESQDAPSITDSYKKAVTARLLENQEHAEMEQHSQENSNGRIDETTNVAGQNDVVDPVMISLVRRVMPNLIAFDLAGVQPMTGPVGIVFAQRSRYNAARTGDEALHDEADTSFSGTGTHDGDSSTVGDGFDPNDGTAPSDTSDPFGVGEGMTRESGEQLGTDTGGDFNEMAFDIQKTTVTAKTRALKAEYTMELVQDLRAIHGLDAETELSNILQGEVIAEINREFIRKINLKARLGAQTGNVASPGTFNIATDSDGRWLAEKVKGMHLQLEREANAIAKATRRGKGNIVLCSSDVASALVMAGVLTYTPAMQQGGVSVDDTGNTFAGTLSNGVRVYIDPYATVDYINVIYRGSNPYDAGMFYCPYVPLTKMRAMGENTFQPKIAFKTRYGMITNPYNEGADTTEEGANRSNDYFRIFKVEGLMVS